MIKIGLDIDGVLADFFGAWHDLYPEIDANPPTWFLDPKIVERFNEMRQNNILDKFFKMFQKNRLC